jgi:hypothetical protein
MERRNVIKSWGEAGPSGQVTVRLDRLITWFERLALLPTVRQLPEVYDLVLTAITDLRDMAARETVDQSRVDMLFHEIVDAIERRRRAS